MAKRELPASSEDVDRMQRPYQCRLAIKALRNGKSTPTNPPSTAPSKLI